jgi:hypothetical protein
MKKSFVRTLGAALLAGALASLPALAGASSIESEIELLRSDLRANKVEIVKDAMHVSGARADAFWPLYRKYQLDLDKIGDKRIALIKEFAANFDSMSDAKAKSLVKQALDLQSQRTNLLKSYYPQFEKVLGAIDAAKLVQVEHLIMAAIDLQLAADLPLIEKPANTN